jgi:multiple sugar transport system ATP-binding protein
MVVPTNRCLNAQVSPRLLLNKDAHTEDVPTHAQGTRFVAAFAPRSRVRIGDEVEVVVDTERMHFFDPDTGMAIRG